jgi:hypothetical protein
MLLSASPAESARRALKAIDGGYRPTQADALVSCPFVFPGAPWVPMVRGES